MGTMMLKGPDLKNRLRSAGNTYPDAAQAVAVVEVRALGVQKQRRAAIGKVRPRPRRLAVARILADRHNLRRLRLQGQEECNAV